MRQKALKQPGLSFEIDRQSVGHRQGMFHQHDRVIRNIQFLTKILQYLIPNRAGKICTFLLTVNITDTLTGPVDVRGDLVRGIGRFATALFVNNIASST